MPEFVRADLISIFDLGFPEDAPLPSQAETKAEPTVIIERLQESFQWLFYDEQLHDFELIDLSARFPAVRGAALRLNRKSRVGTFMIWRSERDMSNAHEFKSTTWDESDNDLKLLRDFWGEPRIERYYPFLALEVETDDVDEYAENHAEEIGRLLTGDLESERPETLRSYVAEDLSLRSYEKLFMRWTDALALYGPIDEEQYENSVFRALQVFEHCILARVSLLSLSQKADLFSRHLTILTPGKWLKSRHLLANFSGTEETFVMYPRVQSVEADRLIRAAHSKFGIDSVASSAKARKQEMQEQIQWAKAQTLGLLAFVTYLLDKVIGWDHVRTFVVTGIRDLLH